MRNEQFLSCQKWLTDTYGSLTIDLLLEEISVLPVNDLDNHQLNPLLYGWFAVCNTSGIVAYFGEETEALKYRLDYINRLLNT